MTEHPPLTRYIIPLHRARYTEGAAPELFRTATIEGERSDAGRARAISEALDYWQARTRTTLHVDPASVTEAQE